MADTETMVTEWPIAADVLILPGIGSEKMGDAFAPTAETVKQELENAGVRVQYLGGDGTLVAIRKSADWWGPVVLAGNEWFRTHGVELLADLITRAIGRMRDTGETRAVVRVGRYRAPGTEFDWLDYDGPADQLAAALKEWAKKQKQ